MSTINRSGPALLANSLLMLWALTVSACGLALDTEARLERARQALSEGDYGTAIIDTRNILQENPDNREARLVLGRAALASGDYATAEKELHRAVELGEDLGVVAVDLAQALVRLGQFDAVLEEIHADVARNEVDRLIILRLRADAIMGQGLPAIARPIYQDVITANSRDNAARLGLARSFAAENDFDQARIAIDEALRINADDVQAWLTSGMLRLRLGDLAGAVPDLERALDLATTSGDRNAQLNVLVALAEAALAEEDLDAAATYVEQVRSLAPEYLMSLYLSARVAYGRKDFELAQNELQEALRAAPNFREAQLLMGAIHLERGNLSQAEMHLSPVVAALPDDANARRLLAETRLRQNRASEAAAILQPIMNAEGSTDFATLDIAVRASILAGDYDSAVSQLKQALQADPDNEALQLDLVSALLAAGNIAEAERMLANLPEGAGEVSFRRELLNVMTPLRRGDEAAALERAQTLRGQLPDDARVYNLIGGIALGMERFDLAEQNFRAAQELAPTQIIGYLNLAQLEMQRGDLEAARRQLETALELEPSSSSLMVALARIEAMSEDREAALAWLERARAVDPDNLAARLLLSRIYLDQENFKLARGVAAEIVSAAPENVEALNILGLAEQGAGDFEAAAARFDRALELEPESSEVRVRAAIAQLRLGNTALAEKRLGPNVTTSNLRESVLLAGIKARNGDIIAALEIARALQNEHPDTSIPFALEGEFLAAQQQYAAAAEAYDKALEITPDDRRMSLRAFAIRREGGVENPTRPLEKYLENRPLDVGARLWLAEAQRVDSYRNDAKANFGRILELDPNNLVALNNLAWMYHEDGDSRAEELARRASDLAPENGNVADTLGWIQVNAGNIEGGIATLRRAVELTNGSAEVQYHLAAALSRAGEKGEARQLLLRALANDSPFASRSAAEALLASL